MDFVGNGYDQSDQGIFEAVEKGVVASRGGLKQDVCSILLPTFKFNTPPLQPIICLTMPYRG